MAVLKKYSPRLKLENQPVFIEDIDSDSLYFNITEFPTTFSGGKNSFLFEGSPLFRKGSGLRFEMLDVNGDTIFIEPGTNAGKGFYDGTSVVMAVHIYDDTPVGVGSISILGELEYYYDENGIQRRIPPQFRGVPNIRWQRTFKINPKLPNSTQVRFYKRPTFSVTEIEKPLLVKTDMTLMKSGSVNGFASTPEVGTDFSNWTAPSSYLLKLDSGNKFTQSMEENTTISIPSLGYSSSVLEVINENEMLVRKPYLVDNKVTEFETGSYSMMFESVEDATVTGSNVTASYAEIRLENLKTFTGDVARIKIFRKSRNDLGDFQVVQENKLDATELLRDFSVEDRTVINYGKLRAENIVAEDGSIYYTTSSGVLIHNEHLINALEIGGNQTIESNGTIGEFEIVSGSEYSFRYTSRYSGSGESVDTDSLRFLIVTSSTNTDNPTITSQSVDILSGSYDRGPHGLSNRINVTKNFFAETTGKCQIRVEANTEETTGKFLFSRLSLKNAEESSYSPDEYTAIVDIPRKNPTEQFDFRVEFYDINNNFIPVKVERSVPFNLGNQATGLEAAINVKNSGLADAGDILNVTNGTVNIANTVIQSSQIAGLGDPTAFSANVAASTSSLEVSASAATIADATTGRLTRTIVPSGSGLFVGEDNLGFYSTNEWKAYLSSSGEFFLSGSGDNSFLWTGNELQIEGDVTASTGNIAGFTIENNRLAGYINSGTTSSVVLDSGQSGLIQYDGDDVGGLVFTTQSGYFQINDDSVQNGWVSETVGDKTYFSVGNNDTFIKFNQNDSDDGTLLLQSASFSGSIKVNHSAASQTGATTKSIDLSEGNSWEVLLINGNTLFLDVTSSGQSQTAEILVWQGTAGNGGLNFSDNVKEPNGSTYVPTAVSGAFDILTVKTFGSGWPQISSSIFVTNVKRFE